MFHLRFLRILLPALLLPFLVFLAFMLRQRPIALSRGSGGDDHAGPRAESIELTDIWGSSRRLFVRARLGELDAEGRLHLEGVDRVEVDREKDPPLVIRADRGNVDGKPGHRVMRLEGGVEVREENAGLVLSLPTLEVDEAASEARSVGTASFEGDRYRGHAASIQYGLESQQTVLASPHVHMEDGSTLTAQRAVLRERLRETELDGGVHVVRASEEFRCAHLRLIRDDDGRLRRAVATKGVHGSGIRVASAPSTFRAERLEVDWGEEGQPTRFAAQGQVLLRQDAREVAADSIEGGRGKTAEAVWEIRAEGKVKAKGILDRAPSALSAEELVVALDERGRLRQAEAVGKAEFEGSDVAGEAARVTFRPSPEKGEVALFSGPGRRARLSLGRTRVAAERISTDPKGERLLAEGRVEATLLPDSKGKGRGQTSSLFQGSEAVHFVASRLESEASGNRLIFRGTVRGWQGDRNLSADEVEMDQDQDGLKARGNVTTRIPTDSAVGLSQADYVQVTAGQLDYSGVLSLAVYQGNARVRQAEGWLEGTRLEVELEEGGHKARTLRASGDVRFELRATAEGGVPQSVTGRGDRLVYTLPDRLVRLFGDKGPASMRREGEGGGTTTGRVLRYRLDDGTLEVESEERDSGRDAGSGR